MLTQTDRTAATAVPLHPLLAGRWSPRAYDPAHELTDDQATALLEAARWAPSSSNSQPWRLALARRGTPEHTAIADTLMPGNQTWATAASALVLVAAQTVSEDGRELRAAVYDTGQAIAHLSLQAEEEGLSVRQMGGFDVAAAAGLIGDDRLRPLVVVAVGQRLEGPDVPEDMVEREQAPRARKPLEAIQLALTPVG